MPNIQNPFDSYCVTISTPPGANDRPIASIWCYQGNENVGWLSFYDNSATLPQPSYANGIIKLNFPIERYDSIMDLIWNDEPLELYFNSEGSWGSIGTRMPYLEPVGKNEPRPLRRFFSWLPFLPRPAIRASS